MVSKRQASITTMQPQKRLASGTKLKIMSKIKDYVTNLQSHTTLSYSHFPIKHHYILTDLPPSSSLPSPAHHAQIAPVLVGVHGFLSLVHLASYHQSIKLAPTQQNVHHPISQRHKGRWEEKHTPRQSDALFKSPLLVHHP